MKISILTLGVAALAGQLMFAQGTPPVQAGTSSSGAISPAQNERVSRLAAQMIQQTSLARKALRANDRSQAELHINNALNFAREIERIQPGRKIVPIYAELESKSVLAPVLEARGQAPAAATPRTDEAQQAAPPVVVKKTTGQFTFIGVNTADSVRQLEAAKAALKNNNVLAADDALRAVEDQVVTAQVSSDMPLLRARQNLALAHTYAKQGRTRDASAALNAAASGLASYSRMNGQYAPQARELEQKVSAYSRTIGQQPPQQAASQIDEWWNETTNWFRQA